MNDRSAEASRLRRPLLLALIAMAPGLQLASSAESSMPVDVHSERSNGVLRTNVEGIVAEPLEDLAPVLASPSHWCRFVPIDPVVRGCVWEPSGDGDPATLTLQGGRERWLLPDTTFELPWRFEVRDRSVDHLRLVLHGDEGPKGTRDYRLEVRATSTGPDRTHVQVSSEFTTSRLLESIMNTYFETLGRDKFGFSVVGEGEDREYVRGVRALIERGAMRHYLALRSYVASLALPPERRIEASLQKWWQLSQQYPQLEEPSRAGYLDEQRRDFRNQSSRRAEDAHLLAAGHDSGWRRLASPPRSDSTYANGISIPNAIPIRR